MVGNAPFAITPSANDVYLNNPSVSYTTGATAALPVYPAALGQALASQEFKTPTSLQWSFNVQQQLSANSVFSVSYVGNQNYHQPDVRNINTPTLGGYYQTNVASGALASNANNQPYNIYPGFAQIPLVEDASNSHYESLQAGVTMRNLKGLTLNVGYTWSHVLDYMSSDLGGNINGQTMDNQSTITNPFNRGYDYGSGDMNRTQILTVAYVYELPFFRKSSNALLKNVAGGWEVSGITTAETGVPITLYMSNGNSIGLGTNDTINRPNVAGPVTYPGTASEYFNPAAFSAPALGQFGNLGRGALKGPGRQNWDMTLIKKFGLGFREGANLEFRADAFNVFNHTQFSAVGTTYGQSTLGQVTSVYDPRVLQLGLTFSF